jgi:hypothetical protein
LVGIGDSIQCDPDEKAFPVKKLVSFTAYQSTWWLCVLGAGSAWAVLGILGTALWSATHLFFTEDNRQWRLVGAATLLGLVVDSGLVVTGAIAFHPEQALGPFPTPLWMVALWTGFGATLTSSFGWALRRWHHAMIFGACAGPVAYLGGQALERIEVGRGVAPLLLVAASWAFSMLLLQQLSRPTSDKAGESTPRTLHQTFKEAGNGPSSRNVS